MSDYNQFVMAVNKIFEITAKVKAGWKDQDNINIADSIEEAKTTVVEAAKLFNTQAPPPTPVKEAVAPTEGLTIEDEVEDNTLASEDIGGLEE